MHMEVKIIIGILAIVATLSATMAVIPVHADNKCYKTGYENGRNGPFDQDLFTACGNDYEHGFMDGCLSVVGNVKEVCNLAEDA